MIYEESSQDGQSDREARRVSLDTSQKKQMEIEIGQLDPEIDGKVNSLLLMLQQSI